MHEVTGPQTLAIESFTDTFWTNCHGPYETGREDPNLERDDSPCYPVGDTHGGTAPPNLVTGCPVFFDAIGDLEYDGAGRVHQSDPAQLGLRGETLTVSRRTPRV